MPYTESWLKLEEESGGRSTLKGTPEELRQGKLRYGSLQLGHRAII